MVEVKIKPAKSEDVVNGFENIHDAIQGWINENNGNVVFMGSFIILKDEIDPKKKDNPIKDNMHVALGPKKMIQANLEVFKNNIDKEKGNIVNW